MSLVVAVLSVIFYAEHLRRQRATEGRRKSYQLRASLNRMYAREFRDAYENRSSVVFAKHHGPVFATTPALRLKWAEYHESLARKYDLAASRPWEVAPPDPPGPEVVPASTRY